MKNTDGPFKETKIVNFDIIHRCCRGENVPKIILKEYQTFRSRRCPQVSGEWPTKIFSSAFRTEKKDIYSADKSTKKHFGKNGISEQDFEKKN